MSRSGRDYHEDARDRVIDAAKRSGVSVGELVQALADTPRAAARRSRRSTTDAAVLDRQLDELSERLKRMTSGEDRGTRSMRSRTDTGSGRYDRDEAPRRGGSRRDESDTGRILDVLDGLDRKVRALAADRRPLAASREALFEDDAPRGRRHRDPVDDLDRATSGLARREDPRRDEARPLAKVVERAVPDLERHFRELSEKMDLLRSRDDRDQNAGLIAEIRALREFIEKRAGLGADVSDEIRRVAQKIDELAARRPERDTIEPLMTEIGRLRDVVLQNNVEGSLRSIEAGYGHIVDRLDDLKRGLAGPRVEAKVDAEISEIHNLLRTVPQVSQFSALERHLSDLALKVEQMASRDGGDGIAVMERRIADLKGHLDSIDPTAVVRALDQRLKVVADKLDDIERAARGPVAPERLASLVDELRTIAAGSRTAEEVRNLETRLTELSDRVAEFDRRRPSFDDTDRLHERIAEIAGKLDHLAAPASDRRTVDALEAAVARLDEMMARAPASAPSSDLIDSRFNALFDRLDRDERAMPVAAPTAEVEALTREIAAMRRELAASRPAGDLEAQMRLLAERLDRSTAHESDDEALAQIEDQLTRISQQLTSTQDRFQDLGALEGQIRRLAERVEDNQLDAVAAAREAAREMVREFGEARGGGDGVSDSVLRALQDDLRSLQSAARDTESRTNDTLISLHDALTGIVGRLAAIEKIAQGSARQAAAARSAAQAAESAVQNGAAQQVAAQPAPMVSAPAAATTVRVEAPGYVDTITGALEASKPTTAANAVARARELLSASASGEDVRPLEPGSGKPSFRASAPSATAQPQAPAMSPIAAARAAVAAVAAGPAAAARAEADVPPAAARKADFIAAARRAAQAAATSAPPVGAAQPQDRANPIESEPTAPEGGDPTSPLARIGQALRKNRRSLVLATAAIVLAVLTFRFLPDGSGPLPEKAAEAPRSAVSTMAAAPTAPETTNSVARRTPAMPAVQAEPEAAPVKPPQTSPSFPGVSAIPPAPVETEAAPQATATQRSGDLLSPIPVAEAPGTPTTTGSIPKTEAQAPAAPAAEAAPLPEKIGSDRLRKAAESGDPAAAFEVGLRFAEGRGVPADLGRAADWYAKAAAKGSIPAQYRLAVAYEKGLGVERSTDKAKQAYLAAAERGNVRAMHNLGVLFANARDMNSAVPWFQRAADLGLKDSQFNLGIIHALGSGVKQDLAVSYKWFSLAAKQGDQEAEKKQGEVAGHLDKVNMAAARMAVQTWVQRQVDREANDEATVWREAPATASAPASTAGARDAVVQVQSMLKAKGLFTGPADGTYGASTRTAIKAFQKKAGLAQTGDIDAALIQALSGKAL